MDKKFHKHLEDTLDKLINHAQNVLSDTSKMNTTEKVLALALSTAVGAATVADPDISKDGKMGSLLLLHRINHALHDEIISLLRETDPDYIKAMEGKDEPEITMPNPNTIH